MNGEIHDHGDCKPVTLEKLAEVKPMVKCSMCGEEYPAPMLWWKGTAYCEHGVPAISTPVCFPCVLAAEAQVTGATVVAFQGEIEDLIHTLTGQSASETPHKTHD